MVICWLVMTKVPGNQNIVPMYVYQYYHGQVFDYNMWYPDWMCTPHVLWFLHQFCIPTININDYMPKN